MSSLNYARSGPKQPSLTPSIVVPVVTVPNQISVYDLYNRMQEKKHTHHECYQIVLERLYARIRRCSSVNRTSCWFDVPEIIVGKPLFDVEQCTRHAMGSLAANGFRFAYHFPRTLNISWDVRIPPPPSAGTPVQEATHKKTPACSSSQQHPAFRSITEFKPNGKFVLRM